MDTRRESFAAYMLLMPFAKLNVSERPDKGVVMADLMLDGVYIAAGQGATGAEALASLAEYLVEAWVTATPYAAAEDGGNGDGG